MEIWPGGGSGEDFDSPWVQIEPHDDIITDLGRSCSGEADDRDRREGRTKV